MRRFVLLFSALALVVVACGGGERQSSIQGTVTGANGGVPVLAHVHLIVLGGDVVPTLESVRVGDDGAFSLEIPDDGYYDLLVTAVNHSPLRIPLVSDHGFTLSGVRIVPAPYQYTDPLEDVAVIGDWAGFSRSAAERMVPGDDGTFTYEREVEADTLAYQLLNVERSGRSINGTDSDYYIYDGGGDYISVVSVEDGAASLSFDPGKAIVPPAGDVPLVDFGGEGRRLAEAWEIRKRWVKDTDLRYEALQGYLEEEGTYDGFEYDLSGLKRYLLEKMSSAENGAARRYAAVMMAGLLDIGSTLEEGEMTAVAGTLPVTDRMWASKATAMVDIFEETYGRAGMLELFEDNLDEVTERKVRAAMLLEVGLSAKGTGDSTRQREIYDDLISTLPEEEAPYISYRIRSELDPDLKIVAGKPVPDFEVALLDEEATVSRSSLLGNHYLIDFWATWCGPCVREMPNLHSAHERFKDSGFEILSISLDQSVNHIDGFRAGQWKMPWLHAFAEGMFESEIATLFEVQGIPKPVLVDPEGIIVAVGSDLRGAALEETLASQLE
jgi:thiol-disulfide isomerase/thioredoxin